VTKKEAAALKRRILGLAWDINRKKAKKEKLARLLVDNAHEHARFSPADYRAFYRSRRITS
jgi:hypothetical protein